MDISQEMYAAIGRLAVATSGLEAAVFLMLSNARFEGKDESKWIEEQFTGLVNAAERFMQTPEGAHIQLPIPRLLTLAKTRNNVMHGVVVSGFINEDPSLLTVLNARYGVSETVDIDALDAMSIELDKIKESMPIPNVKYLADAFLKAEGVYF